MRSESPWGPWPRPLTTPGRLPAPGARGGWRERLVRPVVLQLLRFGVVGVTNTAVTLASYAALAAVGLPAPAAGALAFAAGAANGYRLNRTWTFRSARRGTGIAMRYVAVQGLGAGLDAAGVAAAVGIAQLPRLAGEAAILPAVTLVTFVLCRQWVFARTRSG
jgi:putative flippase GtrA